MYIELVFTPAAETIVPIDIAEVDFWLEGESVPETLDELAKIDAAFDFRIGFRVVG